MTKQYLIKREYLGFKEIHYALHYGTKTVHIMMKWISGVYKIVWAQKISYGALDNYLEFPYKKTVGVIDRIEELLRE